MTMMMTMNDEAHFFSRLLLLLPLFLKKTPPFHATFPTTNTILSSSSSSLPPSSYQFTDIDPSRVLCGVNEIGKEPVGRSSGSGGSSRGRVERVGG